VTRSRRHHTLRRARTDARGDHPAPGRPRSARPHATRGAVALLIMAVAGASPAWAQERQTLCVGDRPGCRATIQAAVDAARDGDVIRIPAGTFAGGVTIDKNVRVEGAGAGATTIKGGGPVLTIVTPDAFQPPTVSIAGVTITGGVTHGDGVLAAGGGVLIAPAADDAPGATVSISRAVIARNRAEATRTVPSGHAECPGGPCPFAQAQGGGISSAGTLSITDSVITDNAVGGIASDAFGAGVFNRLGALSLTRTLVSRNTATAEPPNGRFAEGGGVFVDSGAVAVRDSTLSDNAARLTSRLPSLDDEGALINMNVNGAGIHVGNDRTEPSDAAPVVIDDSRITGNAATASDPDGQPIAIDAALLVLQSPLEIRDSLIAANRTETRSATIAGSGPSGSAVELDAGGTITGTRITDNTSSHTSDDDAGVTGALAILDFDGDPKPVVVSDSVIRANTATASATTGDATAQGAGVFNDSLLDLHDVDVRDNTATARGPSGRAEGAGIWNGDELSGGPVALTIARSTISHNTLTADPAITTRGAGLFTAFPVTVNATRITDNSPDQCSGCP
jgi:hypothetical protein